VAQSSRSREGELLLNLLDVLVEHPDGLKATERHSSNGGSGSNPNSFAWRLNMKKR
jgi:hypothetical protein